MIKRTLAVVTLALALVPLGTGVASAGNPVAETNVTEKIECMFRVYVTEGGENGLDCLT